VKLIEARRHPARGPGRDVGGGGARARVDRHHRTVASEGHDHRGRRPRRRPRRHCLDALVGEHRAHDLAGDVVPERCGDGGREPQACAGDRGDRAAAGRAEEIARESLLAERGQGLEPDEGEVEEHGGGDDEIHHGRARITRATLSR
jgi:hypothetical protein